MAKSSAAAKAAKMSVKKAAKTTDKAATKPKSAKSKACKANRQNKG